MMEKWKEAKKWCKIEAKPQRCRTGGGAGRGTAKNGGKEGEKSRKKVKMPKKKKERRTGRCGEGEGENAAG